jgi:uncharacterized protein YcfJ
LIMKKVLVLSTAAMAGLLAFDASATDILAPVISSTPVVQQVAVPRQVCTNQPVLTEAPRSGAGALLGAVAGGAAGNAIGNGSGRAVATMLGLMGGAIVGNNIEGSSAQYRNVQQCSTQTSYENRASHYNVVYEYQGTQYNVQMPNDPGRYVRLQVTPVGAVNQAQQPQAYGQPAYNQPAPPVYGQPYSPPYSPPYSQPYQPQPSVQPYNAPVYVQPMGYVQPAPNYNTRPYYARPY